MFKKIIEYSNKRFGLFKNLSLITDKRKNPAQATIKIVTAIICMQLSNLGSLNSMSLALASGKYPSVSTIARAADQMDLETIRNVAANIYKRARKQKMLSAYCGMWVGIVDGHEVTASEFCKCSHCRKRNVSKIEGVVKYQYYHCFTSFILAGPKFSFTLDIEPIAPGESEITSAYRLLERVCKTYPKAFEVVIGDALYLKETVFELLEVHHKYSIAVLKEERRQLFEEANRLSLMAEPKIYKQGKTIYRVWDHRIEDCWDGYGKKARVIVSEETSKIRIHARDGNGWEEKIKTANWMWVTNLFEDFAGDLKNTVKVCHSRWQIENKCFNETVNTWKADHIYRHSENAIIAFLLLLFICVNIFNIFRARNVRDGTIKTMVFLINKITAEFLTLKRPLPLIPIPV